VSPASARIHRTIALGFSVPLVLVLVGSFLSWRQVAGVVEDHRWVAHTHEVIRHMEQVLSLLKDVQTGGRGFVLTGDERYLDPFRTAKDEVKGTLARLLDLTRDNPWQHARLRKLGPKVREKIDFQENLIRARRERGWETAMALVRTGKGKELLDDIRRRIGEMKAHEQT